MFASLQAKFILYGGALLAVLAVVWRLFATGKAAGVNQQKAKELAAHEENIKRLKQAVAAGDAVRDDATDILSDPDNRSRH